MLIFALVSTSNNRVLKSTVFGRTTHRLNTIGTVEMEILEFIGKSWC